MAQKRYTPVPFREKLQAYSRTPTVPSPENIEKTVHMFQHESGDMLRLTREQSDAAKKLFADLNLAAIDKIEAKMGELGLTPMQIAGLMINAGWSMIVNTVDILRQREDPLSRSAYLAAMMQQLQFGTALATEARLYDMFGGVEAGIAAMPEYAQAERDLLHPLLDAPALGDYAKAYEHGISVYDRAHPESAPVDDAPSVPDGPVPPMPPLAALGALAGLGGLMDTLATIPVPVVPATDGPISINARPDHKSRRGQSGMMALELIKNESPADFKARIIKEALARGMPLDVAEELAKMILDRLANGDLDMGGEEDDDND